MRTFGHRQGRDTRLEPPYHLPIPAAVQQQKPGLFTALDEQLRLKLESSSAPVDVVIIESIDLPTGN